MSKSLLSRVGSIVLGMAFLLTPLVLTTANAGELTGYPGSGFNKSWERYASGDGGRAGLTYGFNTWEVNEVYAKANHSVYTHSARIYLNGRLKYVGKASTPRRVSSIQGRHTSNNVKYVCKW